MDMCILHLSVPNNEKLLEAFIGGLPRSIEGNVTASKPQTLEEAINISQRLMDQIIKRDSVQETNDHKRKLEDKRNTIDNNNNYPKYHNNNNHFNNRKNDNYQNNHNNHNRNDDYHHQQNRRQEPVRTYPPKRYHGNLPLFSPTNSMKLSCPDVVSQNADFAEIVDFLNANPIRQGKDFSGTITSLFSSMLAQQADMGERSGQLISTDKSKITRKQSKANKHGYENQKSTKPKPEKSSLKPITVPSSSQPKKSHRPRKAKRATEISQSSGLISLVADETVTKKREDRMERAATTASSLEAEQDNDNINKTQSMATLNEPSPQGTGSGSGPRVNTLGSGEDRLKLKELMDLCTKLFDRVLDLETTKTAQAKEIASLKKRVQKMERKRKSKTPRMNLFKIGTSSKRSLGEEDASKQRRNLKHGKQSSIFEESDFDDEGFDADVDEAFNDVEGDAEQCTSYYCWCTVSTAEPITTASANITAAEPITPPTTTTTIFEDDDLTIAHTLVKMRSEKSKVRGLVMQEPSKTATRPMVPPQQHDPKDKGKGEMVEQENPLKKKDQIKFDEEIAQRLQAQMKVELEEEERLAREREEDANIAEWDNAQAMMDDDYKVATRIQAQEQEELTIE
ncbi:hypothetical protein Tco_0146395 [Tanacetum coccineum]